jgi:hypothetical protein
MCVWRVRLARLYRLCALPTLYISNLEGCLISLTDATDPTDPTDPHPPPPNQRRFYSNTYTDAEKQDAINLFLGQVGADGGRLCRVLIAHRKPAPAVPASKHTCSQMTKPSPTDTQPPNHLPQFIPQPGRPALWELDSDYYLWNRSES